ncbi:MAG: hypothetical protein HYY24_14405 [Verrucomicrobia bacterium]|nr:hypothetical protein [Verrucomicrobiota bacterium]
MNVSKSAYALINVALMLPALLLCTAGVLFLAFGIEGANRFLETLMATTPGKLLLSPFVVLGGPVVVVALNIWKVCHVSAERIDDEIVIALSIKRIFGHLLCVGVGTLLTILLLSYAFVENFRVVAR